MRIQDNLCDNKKFHYLFNAYFVSSIETNIYGVISSMKKIRLELRVY